MSLSALAPSAKAAGGPSDVAAAAQRVQQLQEMIAHAKQGSSATSFAAALNAASAGTAAYPVATAASVPASAAAPSPSGSASTPYDGAIAAAAARYNLDPAVLHGLIQQESGFDPNSRSSAGALGLTQLMPGTASSLGVANPLDPVESIEGGARYLSQMMSQFGGNTEEALAAYNAGPGAVSQYGGVPPYAETRDYVSKVLGYANAYRQSSTIVGTPSPTGSIA
jgi:soluble lytic murein transglycosylase-like protein